MCVFFSNKKNIILFYGSKGWIGGLFLKYIKEKNENIIIFEGKARLDKKSDVLIEISAINPTHVISFTGRTHGEINGEKVNTIDYLEYPGKLVENVKDNLFGPVQLGLLCEKKGIHYSYLGTGCIFNSEGLSTDTPQLFDEDSLPNYFGSGYSVVKGFTDQLMHMIPALNLRIRMPIHSCSNPRNFINKIVKYEKICSIPNSMTVLDDFFPIFLDLILKKKTGTYNCTNPGTISHNEILELYREMINPNFTWQNFTLEEQQKILKSDRSNNALKTLKISSSYDILNINESMKNIIKNFKNKSLKLLKS
jgi:3,5-epimerase/4-reductase